MPSIVDMIAEAEAEAEKIKTAAAAKAKQIIDDAKAQAQKDNDKADAEVKRLMLFRRESANHSAERLTLDILQQRKADSANNCELAKKNSDKAVKYIIERVAGK